MKEFIIIYKILNKLRKSMDFDEFDLGCLSADYLKISENKWLAILEMLCKSGYIDGLDIKRSADGEVYMSDCGIRITLKGLEYLEENPLMKKAAEASKGIVDAT